MNGESAAGKVFDWLLFKRLLPFATPYRRGFAFAIICMITGTALELVGPLITRRAIDDAIPHGDYYLLALLVAGYLIVTATGNLLRYLETQISGRCGLRVVWDIRKKVFTHFQRQSLVYFDRNPVGRMITRVTSDVAAVSELFGAGLVGLVGDILSLLGILTILFLIDWRLALITLTVTPLLVTVSLLFRKYVRGAFRAMRHEITRTNTYLQESITGMRVVKLFLRERKNAEQFEVISQGLKRAQMNTIFFFALFFPAVDLLGTTAVAATLLTGGYFTLAGSLTVGTLVAFLQYGERFFRPIRDLTEKYNVLQSAFAGAERVFGVLDEPAAITSPSRGYAPAHIAGRIDFEHVSFEYEPGVPVLCDVSLSVAPGSSVALVGATGAGKSTVLSLLGRHYDVTAGAIRIDGVDVREYDLTALRRRMAVVLQDVFLFAGTVAENIAMNDSVVARSKIEWAASEIGADAFIRRLPQDNDTTMLERALNLSVGQKQLLSLARALATDPAILLLDEATSAVDSETEALLQQGLACIMQGRTAIVVAHRLSTVQHADRILVFHKGRLREEGNHFELMQMNGIYARLFRLQFDAAA